MTRETKAGLVVASSFLCLVGVVLALKLKQTEDAAKGLAQANVTEPGASKGKTNPPPSAASVQPGPKSGKQPEHPGSHPSSPEPSTLPPSVVQANAKEVLQSGPNPSPHVPESPQVPLPAQPVTNPPPPATAIVQNSQTGGVHAPPAQTNLGPGETVPLPPPNATIPVSPPPVDPPVAPESKNNDPTLNLLKQEVEKSKQGQNNSAPLLSSLNGGNPPPILAPEGPNKNGPTVIVPPGTGTVAPPPNPADLQLPAASMKSETQPPVSVPPSPTNPANPPPPEIKGIDVTPTAPIPPPVLTPAPVVSPPAPVIEGNTVKPPTNPVKEGPAPISVPLSPPRPVQAPQVTVTETKIYTLQAADKTFADLSKKFYGTPDHAEALLRFNRDYPMANDGIRQNPPVLQPGQRVFNPDLATLQQGTSSPTTTITPKASGPGEGSLAPPLPSVTVPVSPAPPPSVTSPVSPTPPPAPGVGMSTSANLRAVASTAGSGDGQVYQVAAGGEMLMNIAERILGDRNRWSDIYRLNQQISPQYLIPAGIVLKMPGGPRAVAASGG